MWMTLGNVSALSPTGKRQCTAWMGKDRFSRSLSPFIQLLKLVPALRPRAATQLTSRFSLARFIPFADPLYVSHLCSLALLSNLSCCSSRHLLSSLVAMAPSAWTCNWCTHFNAGPSPWEQHASALRISLTCNINSEFFQLFLLAFKLIYSEDL